jgi:hypothetical protein
MDYFPLIIFLILIIILLITFDINIFLKKNYLEENFSGSLHSLPLSGATAYLHNYDIPISQSNTQLNPLDNNYLYPSSCKLNDQCKAMGLIGSSNPSICIQNGKIRSDSICACEDENGNCKICYDKIKEIQNESNIIYNDNINMTYHAYDIKNINPDLLIDVNFTDVHGISPKLEYEELINNAELSIIPPNNIDQNS